MYAGMGAQQLQIYDIAIAPKVSIYFSRAQQHKLSHTCKVCGFEILGL